MEINKVNMKAFDETVAEADKDPSAALKTLKVEGKWRLGEKGPQFESELKYENGRVVLYTDEPSFLGEDLYAIIFAIADVNQSLRI